MCRLAPISRRYASALDSPPGHVAKVAVALATTGVTPTLSNAGRLMNAPPATEFSAPATTPAPNITSEDETVSGADPRVGDGTAVTSYRDQGPSQVCLLTAAVSDFHQAPT